MKKRIYPAAVLALAVATLFAQAADAPPPLKPETAIKWRQSAFQVIAWNSGRIKALTEGPYNKEEAVKAANTLAALANGGLFSLFVPGSETGKGWHDTTSKPELFKDPKRLAELSAAFGKEATELAHIAQNGDQASLKEQYGKLTRSCKSCHDDFKSKD